MERKLKSPLEIFNAWAEKYQDKFMDTALYHNSFDIFGEMTTAPNAQILDIGCGPGNITKYLLSKRADFKIVGIDLAPNMISLAKANNPSADFQVIDCREISKIDIRFDGIVCGFCLPYLSPAESQKLIADCAKLLKPEGTIYISTMEEDAVNHSGIKKNSAGEETYIHYYSEKQLRYILEFNNFNLVDIQRKTYIYNNCEVTDIILIAKSKC